MTTATAAFLGALAPADARALRAGGVERRFRPGDTLLRQDDEPGRVLVIQRGRVKISHLDEDGRETILGHGYPGDPVGELAAIDGQPRLATVQATEPVLALAFSGDAFRTLLFGRPGVAVALLRHLAAKVRALEALRIDQASRNVVGRVAARLVELSGGLDPPPAGAPELTLGDEELAAWVGASREAASRALQLLRTLGAVDVRGRRILVLDRAALERYAR